MFIETASADGEGTATTINSVLVVKGTGTFGSGTMTIEKRDSNGAWTAEPGATATSDFSFRIENNRPSEFRWALTGSSSPTIVVEFS